MIGSKFKTAIKEKHERAYLMVILKARRKYFLEGYCE